MNALCDPRLPDIVQSVLGRIEQNGFPYEIKVFESSASHAIQAAELIGCPLGAVVKSLVFVTHKTMEYKLMLVSGDNRVADERTLEIFQQPMKPVKPQDVRDICGFPVGAVPPFGHRAPMPTYMDFDLVTFDRVWASAGATHILMGVSPRHLQEISKAIICDVKV